MAKAEEVWTQLATRIPKELHRRLKLHCVTHDIALMHFVVEALRRPVESAQYLSIRYTERLAAAGLEPSVGSVGDSYDNALAESVIGLYKTEVVRRQGPWRHVEAVEFATLAWVDWFNTRRLLAPIGYVPPIEFEDAYYREQHCQTTPAMGAGIM